MNKDLKELDSFVRSVDLHEVKRYNKKLQEISDKLDKWDKILNGELMVMSKEEYRRRGNQSGKYQILKSGLEEIIQSNTIHAYEVKNLIKELLEKGNEL